MTPITERFTGIPSALLSDPDAAFSLARPLPLWAWLLVIAATSAAVWVSYRRLDGSPTKRAALACVRTLTLLTLLVLTLGPRIEKSKTRVERDSVYVLIDESRSMTTSDPSAANPEPRTDQLARELTALAPALERLAQRTTIERLGFADTTRVIDDPSQRPQTRGDRTRIAHAINDALDRAGTAPLSSILLLSDGRADDTLDPDTLERLRQSDVPVFTRAIGSPDPVRDAAIAAVQAPSAVFKGDAVPIELTLSTRGYSPDDPVLVELVDASTNDVLARTRAEPTENQTGTRRAVINTDTSTPGDKDLVLRVVPGPGSPDDQIPDNDTRTLTLRVLADPIRVLYIDGHPRWEYRYLKNILLREESIDATSTIIARDRRFIVEGNTTQPTIPSTPEQWAPFDVIIIGDLAPELLSDTQQRTLLEHVSERGAGVLMIAGPGAMPTRWDDAPLSVLLPIRDDANAQPLTTPGVMSLKQAAARAGVLVTASNQPAPRVDDPTTGWSLLRWSAPVAPASLKPGVAVLANLSINDTQPGAIVTTSRYGAGSAGYVGTDEIWRWRYGRGEPLPERFWVPLVRSLARGTIDRRGATARLTARPQSPAPGQPTSIVLDVFDTSAISALPERLDASVAVPGAPEPLTLELTGRGDTRETLWSPSVTGPHDITLTHPALGPDPVRARLDVRRVDAESRDPSTDHQSLATLANQSGGRTLTERDLSTFDTTAPNRTRVSALAPEITPLWDTPLVLALLVTLLSIEWIGRRIMRLA